METHDAEEYTASVVQIGRGWYRQIQLATRLGVPAALGLSTDEWVKTRIGGYVRMEVDERRAAVKELANEGHSTREIASFVGVAHETVRRDLDSVTNVTEKAATPGVAVTNVTTPPDADEPPDHVPIVGRMQLPGEGLQLARMAIFQMQKIRPNDPERSAAFQAMRTWLDENERKRQRKGMR